MLTQRILQDTQLIRMMNTVMLMEPILSAAGLILTVA